MKTLQVMIFLVIVFSTTVMTAQTKELDKAKAEIAELLKNKFKFYHMDGINPISDLSSPKNILVLDDRIELIFKKNTRTIYYTDYFNHAQGSNCVDLGNIEFISIKDNYENAVKLAENLLFIQHKIFETQYNSQLLLFEPVAVNYRNLKVKPSLTEEQRKYIVQANSFSEQKMYDKAIGLYNKAVEIDPTAYPAAYSNLALLSAQTNRFNEAIFYMKKYLMLEPKAADARGAQDKIYLWEAQITK
jgi:tetratricopeptide (TPR) repeat protein